MSIWVNAFFWGVAPLNPIRWGRYTVEPFGTGCLLDFDSRDMMYIAYLLIMATVCFVIPVGAMVYCALNVKVEKRKVCVWMQCRLCIGTDNVERGPKNINGSTGIENLGGKRAEDIFRGRGSKILKK